MILRKRGAAVAAAAAIAEVAAPARKKANGKAQKR